MFLLTWLALGLALNGYAADLMCLVAYILFELGFFILFFFLNTLMTQFNIVKALFFISRLRKHTVETYIVLTGTLLMLIIS
jgi:hypothetical protein